MLPIHAAPVQDGQRFCIRAMLLPRSFSHTNKGESQHEITQCETDV